MPEIPNVVDSVTPIEASWGNAIRDRTVQRYADAAERSADHPSPTPGDLSYTADAGLIQFYHSGGWQSLIPSGAVIPFAAGSPPSGWLICDGQAVSRSIYSTLFAVIGETFGAGDGSTTFNVPDLRQRFPLGVAAAGTGSALAETGGAIDHRHTGPAHTHTGPAHTHSNPTTAAGGSHSHPVSGALVSGSGATFGNSGAISEHTHTTTAAAAHSHTQGATGSSGTGATGSSGTGNTGTANPPFIALFFIIKT